MEASVTICVLTYGPYPELARQCINSILALCPRQQYRLVVGANAVCDETHAYLAALKSAGLIDELQVSEENSNKCPMMKRLFQRIDTPFIWWFDDDSYVLEPQALPARLEIAAQASEDTVMWGHVYYYGNEKDFNYGTDVAGFVKSRPWYKGLEPPSWEKGGKGETDFQDRGTGDGRWFFITGGNWLIRTSAVRQLDWPDSSLIKRNDDVFLCEAIRQQGWHYRDIGPLGVNINSAPRRGTGEDRQTMIQQLYVQQGKGCVFIPTFRDSDLLEENYGDRPELTAAIHLIVVDDNYEEPETNKIKELCAANGWIYRCSGRGAHGEWREHFSDGSVYNHFIWSTFMELAGGYDYVIKMDTDALILSPDFFLEMDRLLYKTRAAAGTPEHRHSNDIRAFWELSGVANYAFRPNDYVSHLQGGIYGISQAALYHLREMGFLYGVHNGFSEDGYMSYSCHLLDIPLLPVESTGSWWHPYLPELGKLGHLKAIHPMTKSKWEKK
jgi:GT2 family glycosyltransferase